MGYIFLPLCDNVCEYTHVHNSYLLETHVVISYVCRYYILYMYTSIGQITFNFRAKPEIHCTYKTILSGSCP